MIDYNKEIKKLEKEIKQLEIDKFSYLCNDQYDVCDSIDVQIEEKRQKVKEMTENE